MVYRVK